MSKQHSFFSTLIAIGLMAGTAFAGTKTINLSAFDTMKYNTTRIEANAGDTLTVTLRNEGSLPKEAMAHNWVLLKPGSSPDSYAQQAMAAKGSDYQPSSLGGEVVASIRLLGPQESGKVTFKVPGPGTYPFLCSFPAHCAAGMKGVLVVK